MTRSKEACTLSRRGYVMALNMDLWKEHRDIFSPSAKEPQIVKVPPINYLLIDGEGDPNTSASFREAIGALYGMAYTLKFMLKKERGQDFRVMPLSGLFHSDDPAIFLQGRKNEWRWTLVIALPPIVKAADFAKARKMASVKKTASPALPLVRRGTLKEGLCAQILHRGPYAAERPTIEMLHAFIREKGLFFAGSHHEIYLTDPNRSAPAKMKTIIRQPVRRTGAL